MNLQLFADEAGAAENEAPQEAASPAEETETQEGETEAQTQSGENLPDMARIRLLAHSVAGARLNEQARASAERECAELRESYPSFSLESEMKNPQFSELLRLGVPMKTAYEAANFSLLLSAAMHYAAEQTAKKTAVSPVRVGENPVLGRASAVRKPDVNSLTKADIIRIIEASRRGEKITFR